MRNRDFIKSVFRGLLPIALLVGFAATGASQGVIVEISGIWKRSNGVVVQGGQRIGAQIRINNVSNQPSDRIYLTAGNGKIIRCSDGCTSLEVPNTQTWGGYLWCKFIGCRKSVSLGAKGGECDNFDTFAIVDRNNITDLSMFFQSIPDKGDVLDLIFQRRVGKRIWQIPRRVKTSVPQVEGLRAGFYQVTNGTRVSRILVLPPESYEKEKPRYLEFRKAIIYWKQEDLSDCIVRNFVHFYFDHVAKKYRSSIRQRNRRTP